MRTTLLAAACLLACSGCAHRQPVESIVRGEVAPGSLRATSQGAVVGFADKHETHAWLGIPYAEPPVGELRWRAPRPPKPWQGTREAVRFGPKCVQFAGFLSGDEQAGAGEVGGSEDCLTLNVWAPRAAPDAVPQGDQRLPVMVWIHGGGNAIGTGSSYGAISNLAGKQRVVAITVDFRLGVLGWFHHPALHDAQDSAEDRSGNYGTLDLVQALKWVQGNIAAFGGDPGNVTIFGESGGGFDVFSLLVSPAASGLFHRAISQSGMTATFSMAQAENFTDDEAEPGEPGSSKELLVAMLEKSGAAKDRAEAKAKLAAMSPAEIAAYLRARTAKELLAPFANSMAGMYRSPRLLRDGAVLPLDPIEKVLADPARGNRVPVIAGSNRDEFKLFNAFNPKVVRLWFGVIPRVRNQARYDRFSRYMSETWKALAADWPATAMVSSGWPGVYVYRFDWDRLPNNWPLHLRTLLGAAHTMEIPYVFGDSDGEMDFLRVADEENAEDRRELAEMMSGYWAQFARTGAPGRGTSGKLPDWKPWSERPHGPKTMILDTHERGGLRMTSETVTLAGIKQRLLVDSTVREDPEEICATYALAFRTFGGSAGLFDPAEYEKLGDRGCKEYPADSFWPGNEKK